MRVPGYGMPEKRNAARGRHSGSRIADPGSVLCLHHGSRISDPGSVFGLHRLQYKFSPSTITQRRERVKVIGVVTPSPVGVAME